MKGVLAREQGVLEQLLNPGGTKVIIHPKNDFVKGVDKKTTKT